MAYKVPESYVAFYAWGMDFWRAFLMKPRILRWLVRKIMGRYAWNELVGLKECVEKINDQAFNPDIGYNCEECDYHNDLDHYKDW
jgi:hypothetical protein